jgi:hypothetical protein
VKVLIKHSYFFLVFFFTVAFVSVPNAHAQQTLGGITGTVTDSSGAVVVNATVTLIGDQTKPTFL